MKLTKLCRFFYLDDPEELIVSTQGKPMSWYDEIRIVDEDDGDVDPGEVGQLLTRGPPIPFEAITRRKSTMGRYLRRMAFIGPGI